MITPPEANQLADRIIADYSAQCGVEAPEDIRKVLEMLISKAARGIEKYCDTPTATDVLIRTSLHIATNPQRLETRQ
jgi:hypothetical protein